MGDAPPRLLQLGECASGSATSLMERARSLGFRHMLLTLDDPVEASSCGFETPVLCIGHAINRDVMHQWATKRYRQDPLRRMKARGNLDSFGLEPILWENEAGHVTLSNGRATMPMTACERDTMNWVYGYGARTGVNVRPAAIRGRGVSISFYSDQVRDRISRLDDVMAILFYLSHRLVDELRNHLTIPKSEQTVRLTRRETECLGWVAEGKNAQETALIMGLSVQTVRDHLKRVRAKLGSSTRAQALLRASAMGLLSSHH